MLQVGPMNLSSQQPVFGVRAATASSIRDPKLFKLGIRPLIIGALVHHAPAVQMQVRDFGALPEEVQCVMKLRCLECRCEYESESELRSQHPSHGEMEKRGEIHTIAWFSDQPMPRDPELEAEIKRKRAQLDTLKAAKVELESATSTKDTLAALEKLPRLEQKTRELEASIPPDEIVGYASQHAPIRK